MQDFEPSTRSSLQSMSLNHRTGLTLRATPACLGGLAWAVFAPESLALCGIGFIGFDTLAL